MPKSNQKKSKKSAGKIREIYLDYASSAMANPSSIHKWGVEAKTKLERARTKVAETLGARPGEIIFTSGGTESNNLAIQGIVLAWHELGRENNVSKLKMTLPHIITTNIEHPSVLDTCRMLERRHLAQISIVSVEVNGIVDPKKIRKEIKKNTILVSVMYANNEIGTIQPIRDIAKVVRHFRKSRKNYFQHGQLSFPLFHTDAVQAVNHLDLNVERLGVDLLSLSSSKVEGASNGVGVLYKKKAVRVAVLWGGGDQEQGLRPGTENLAGILKFTKALETTREMKNKEMSRVTKLRDYFVHELQHSSVIKDAGVTINGDLTARLPNNVSITIPKIESDLLVIEFSGRGIMTSAKSACKSGDEKVSYVVRAINKKIKETDGLLRFSLGRGTTKSDIDYVIKSLSQVLKKLKNWYTPTPISKK